MTSHRLEYGFPPLEHADVVYLEFKGEAADGEAKVQGARGHLSHRAEVVKPHKCILGKAADKPAVKIIGEKGSMRLKTNSLRFTEAKTSPGMVHVVKLKSSLQG